MRQKRAKAYKKLMYVYSMNFGFRQPYQVLDVPKTFTNSRISILLEHIPVDSEICSEAISSKVDLAKQLATVLQGTVKPMITQCSIHSLYLSGRDAQPVVDLAKTFERRRCNHREAKPEEECVKEVIGSTNKHRYVLAAQSPALRQYAREIPGTPIIHVKRSVMVLEPASEATHNAKSSMEGDRLKPTESEANMIASTIEKSDGDTNPPPKKKKRGPKGPNPLSVKKKKPKESERQPQSRKPKEDAVRQPDVLSEKRKRPDDEEDELEDNGALQDSAGTELKREGKRKRNRRRKREDGEHRERPAESDDGET